jgi:hypothetical protein
MGKFKKGHKTWNKGLKGIHLSPDTEFKVGEHSGSDSYTWKGGVQVIKDDCVYLWDGCNKRARRPRKVYEDAYGCIPDGYVIYHIDGDKHNDELSNLEAISRGELIKRNTRRRNGRA